MDYRTNLHQAGRSMQVRTNQSYRLRGNNTLLKVLIAYYFCLIPYSLIAQQCGYEHYGAFVVSVREYETNARIHGLRLSLCYSNGNVIRNVGEASNKGVLCYDDYIFWENKKEELPSQRCDQTKMFRQVFPNASDNYICIVPIKNKLCALSHFAHQRNLTQSHLIQGNLEGGDELGIGFFLYLKIEDPDRKRNGGKFATQFIRIPLASMVDICSNHLHSVGYHSSGELEKKNIQVYLKPNEVGIKPSLFNVSFGHYLLPLFKEDKLNPEYSAVSRELDRIVEYDEQSGKAMQNILYDRRANKEWSEGGMEFVSWHNDRIQQHKVFRVPAKWVKEVRNFGLQPYVYYHYLLRSKVYAVDTLLNNKDYITYIEDSKKIVGINVEEKEGGWVKHIYHFIDSSWRFMESRVIKEDTILPEAPKPKMPFVQFDTPQRSLPVQYFDTAEFKVVRDTIWIWNIGNTYAELQANSPYFSIPARIEPGQRLPIVYSRSFEKEKLQHAGNFVHSPMDMITDACVISYLDKKGSIGMSYWMMKETAERMVAEDGAVHFQVPALRDYLMVYVNGQGYIQEMGKQTRSGCRYGKWQKVNAETGLTEFKQYHKILNIGLQNDTLSTCSVTLIKKWDATNNFGNEQGRFCIPPNISSILVRKDSLSILHLLDFESMEEEENLHLYLLKPGQPYVYDRKVKVPIDYGFELYQVKWTEKYLQSIRLRYANEVDALKSYFDSLLEKFPSLKYFSTIEHTVSKHLSLKPANFSLQLSACTEKDKKKIKSIMEEDSNISTFSILLNNQASTYCDNKVLVYNRMNTPLDSVFLQKASELGFHFTNTHSAPEVKFHYFGYEKRVVDEDFFSAYNALCESTRVYTISLNTYRAVEPTEFNKILKEFDE